MRPDSRTSFGPAGCSPGWSRVDAGKRRAASARARSATSSARGSRPGEAVRSCPARTNTCRRHGPPQLAPHTAESLLAPALRQADHEQGRPSASAAIPWRPGGASSGSATMPAVRWTISEASASSRPHRVPPRRLGGRADQPQRGVRGAGNPSAERAPPSRATGAEGHHHGPLSQRAAGLRKQGHVAGCLFEDHSRVAVQRRRSSIHEEQVDVSGRRAGRCPRPAAVRRTPRSRRRVRRPAAGRGARPGPGWRQPAQPPGRRPRRQLVRDSEAASGSARRSSGSRPYSARGTIRSARSATGRSAAAASPRRASGQVEPGS